VRVPSPCTVVARVCSLGLVLSLCGDWRDGVWEDGDFVTAVSERRAVAVGDALPSGGGVELRLASWSAGDVFTNKLAYLLQICCCCSRD
jgi:hypothetical protein